jgi:phosphoadenosine phosphosulfate reductase
MSSSLSPPAALDCAEVHQILEPLSAEKRISWAVETFSDGVVLLSSMQRTSIVLMHMFHTLGLSNEILFLDTGYHFVETLRMRDAYMRQYQMNIVTLYPELTIEEQEAQYGKKLFSCADGQPECCRLRKEAPLLRYLATKKCPVAVNGLRRTEGGRRAGILALTADPRIAGFSLSPIYDWTSDDIQAYITKHQLSVHPLYAKSYASIGCSPCTTPIKPGEDVRAGRWRHLRPPEDGEAPLYCGINFTDGSGI